MYLNVTQKCYEIYKRFVVVNLFVKPLKSGQVFCAHKITVALRIFLILPFHIFLKTAVYYYY